MSEACLNQTIPMDRSVLGTEAYWAAQREAFVLIEAWQTTDPDDPWAELAALRRIAAHPSAAGVMHAHGRGVAIDSHRHRRRTSLPLPRPHLPGP